MHKIKNVYKRINRYWQHEETGNVAIATWKPSSHWYQINKKQYQDYLNVQQSAQSVTDPLEKIVQPDCDMPGDGYP